VDLSYRYVIYNTWRKENNQNTPTYCLGVHYEVRIGRTVKLTTYLRLVPNIYRANWHSPATLTEGFPCFFLSCKANARV